MVGHSIDEEFEINVTFPENYNAENLRASPQYSSARFTRLRLRNTLSLTMSSLRT